MAAWTLVQLRALVDPGNPVAQAALDSIGRSVNHFRFHTFSCRDALKELSSKDESHSRDLMVMTHLLSNDIEDRKKLALAHIQSHAHLVGAVLTFRAMADYFGGLVNATVLAHKFAERDCYLESVAKALPSSPLKDDLNALLGSDWYCYARGYSNTHKHRALVPHDFRFAGADSDYRVGEVVDRDRRFPDYWITEILHGLVSVKNQLIDCGPSLNVALGLPR